MKSLLVLACLISVPTLCLAAIDYQLDINLQPELQRLNGSARITSPVPEVQWANMQLAQSCEIDSVAQQGEPLEYSFDVGILELVAAQNGTLEVNYHCAFNDVVDAQPVHNEDPSYGVSATISAAGVYLSSAVSWYPRLNSQQVNYQVNISAPAGFEAITSGQRTFRETVDNRSSSHWLVDYPLRGLTLSAGHYQIIEELNGSVPIYAYFTVETAPLAENYLRQARSYLNLYEELFGPYPFHKFAIVENFFPTGYGFPSWTLLGSSVIKLPFIVKTSLGHEIAHSWWGTGVQVDYAQGNWAEGLTTYVADYLYKEQSSAEEARDYRLKILRDYASLVSAENLFSIADFSSRHDKASQAIGYGKTAMLFHMLRQKIGEQAFWTGLRQVASERMFSQVSWNDFAEQFSAVSKQDQRPFFRQWLTSEVGPQLELQEVKQLKTENGWQISGKLLQRPDYRLSVELQLQTETETLTQQVLMNSASQSFRFDSPSQPIALQVDPNADLFRVLAAEEIPATVNSIRGSNQLLVLRADNAAPDTEAIKTLLGALRKTQLPIQSFSEISQEQLAAHDLLIIGLPESFLPANLVAATMDKPRKPDQSIFIVERNRLNSERSVAWFIGSNPQTAVVARKIPHYGKYSFLMFAGHKNQRKEIWTPTDSPLKFEF